MPSDDMTGSVQGPTTQASLCSLGWRAVAPAHPTARPATPAPATADFGSRHQWPPSPWGLTFQRPWLGRQHTPLLSSMRLVGREVC